MTEHGGRIDVETEVGKGTTMIVTIPTTAHVWDALAGRTVGASRAVHRPSQGQWHVVHAATHPAFGPPREDVRVGAATARGALARDVRPRRGNTRGVSRGSRAGGFGSGNDAGTSRVTGTGAAAPTTGLCGGSAPRSALATPDAREREQCGARRGDGDAGCRRDAHGGAGRRVSTSTHSGSSCAGTLGASESSTALTRPHATGVPPRALRYTPKARAFRRRSRPQRR